VQYISCIIFSAPFIPIKVYLTQFPFGIPSAVYHGPTSFIPLTHDPYVEAKKMNIYHEIGNHEFQDVNAGEIVQRILKSREMYEERQRAKGEKAVGEEAVRRREEMEQVAAERERERLIMRRK
jgi:ethanolamine-phosphate cytidylyltransferase